MLIRAEISYLPDSNAVLVTKGVHIVPVLPSTFYFLWALLEIKLASRGIIYKLVYEKLLQNMEYVGKKKKAQVSC